MTAQQQHLTPVPSVTDDVHRYLTLKDARQTIDDELNVIKNRLATTIGAGHQVDVGDVTVSVRPPNRRFNLDAALQRLPEDRVADCLKVDPTLVKRHLTQVQVDECMEPGTGDPIVEVK